MEPAEFYSSILQSITDQDLRNVARIMINHIGKVNFVSIESISREVFGAFNTSTERKAREILETLTVEYHMPICSISGKSGRWLAADEEEIESAARELETRGKHTLDRARALRMAIVPAKEPSFNKPKQSSLWR